MTTAQILPQPPRCIVCGAPGLIKASDDGRTILCVPCAIVAMGLKDDER